MKFEVRRQHLGDKMYMPGDIREIGEAEVKHLVDRGVLVKAGAVPRNKAERAAAHNKSGKPKDSDAQS